MYFSWHRSYYLIILSTFEIYFWFHGIFYNLFKLLCGSLISVGGPESSSRPIPSMKCNSAQWFLTQLQPNLQAPNQGPILLHSVRQSDIRDSDRWGDIRAMESGVRYQGCDFYRGTRTMCDPGEYVEFVRFGPLAFWAILVWAIFVDVGP